MVDEGAHLAQGDRHIADTKERIRKQQQVIERLAAKGYHVDDAESLLSALSTALSGLQRHRLLILQRSSLLLVARGPE